ncbi:MAG TPA: PAS domain S-box protein [Terriglobales bacterium]|nr:PAS domain S-box protein [Terriglobales bacterium]
MGDKVTPPVRAAEILRARFLKAVLDRGTPFITHTASNPQHSTAQKNWFENDPEIQKAYLEDLIESAPEGITILDADHHVLRVNGEFSRMFGYTAEEALGELIGALIVPSELHSEHLELAETLNRGTRFSVETRRRRKDGSLLDVAILGAPVSAVSGKVAAFCIYRDISEQKRSEALRSALYRIAEETSSAEDLQQFYAAIHKIVAELMYARNFYIALVDAASQSLNFVYWVDEEDPVPPPRKLGRGLTEYVLRTGEPLLVSPEVFDDLVRRGEVDSIGSPSVDWLGVPLKLGNRLLGVVVVQSYTDNVRFKAKDEEILTFVSQQLASAIEHKQNEQALRRSEARYRSLVESALYGIYRARRDGKFLDVNPALVSMLGYRSSAEVLALDPERDVFPNPAEQQHLLEQCQRTGRLDNCEVKWKRKDGNIITVRLTGQVASSEDDPDEFLRVIAEDVTERRVLEDQFRQAQKMEAVGRLAGGVAHDFNNLLMVISGYTEVLIDKLQGATGLHDKAEAIQQAAERATSLTRQLLAFSRKQLLELKVVDLNTVIGNMEPLLVPLIGENIELVLKLQPGLGSIRADAGQLEQVLMNLVVNAKDAMPNGGKLFIATSNVDLDASHRPEHVYIKPGAYVMFSVRDNGCGMDRETQSRIFEPFFTTKEKGKGTGLGLSTVYGIVKQSGGYIQAQSEPNHGTIFRIYLPRVEETGDAVDSLKQPASENRGWENVLLVEDEESVRQLVRETLESRGYRVFEAENGEEALKIAAGLTDIIHLVISDVAMPGMSGQDLAQRIQQSRPGTKVLFLSGYGEDTVAPAGGLPSGTGFLQKPFTLQNLSRKVRDILSS